MIPFVRIGLPNYHTFTLYGRPWSHGTLVVKYRRKAAKKHLKKEGEGLAKIGIKIFKLWQISEGGGLRKNVLNVWFKEPCQFNGSLMSTFKGFWKCHWNCPSWKFVYLMFCLAEKCNWSCQDVKFEWHQFSSIKTVNDWQFVIRPSNLVAFCWKVPSKLLGSAIHWPTCLRCCRHLAICLFVFTKSGLNWQGFWD